MVPTLSYKTCAKYHPTVPGTHLESCLFIPQYTVPTPNADHPLSDRYPPQTLPHSLIPLAVHASPNVYTTFHYQALYTFAPTTPFSTTDCARTRARFVFPIPYYTISYPYDVRHFIRKASRAIPRCRRSFPRPYLSTLHTASPQHMSTTSHPQPLAHEIAHHYEIDMEHRLATHLQHVEEIHQQRFNELQTLIRSIHKDTPRHSMPLDHKDHSPDTSLRSLPIPPFLSSLPFLIFLPSHSPYSFHLSHSSPPLIAISTTLHTHPTLLPADPSQGLRTSQIPWTR